MEDLSLLLRGIALANGHTEPESWCAKVLDHMRALMELPKEILDVAEAVVPGVPQIETPAEPPKAD